MKFDKEFKEAISQLPSKEKDKLLLRLLKKDMALANELYFKLLSNQSVEEKRASVEELILKKIKRDSDQYYSPGYLHMDMRYISGDINEHVKITKDKFGEIYLNLLMLNKVLEYNSQKITEATYGKAYKFCIYVIARTYKIMCLSKKLHEDYLIDIENDFKELGNQIGANHYLMETAINNSLDVNWLLSFEIPEDIEAMVKQLRAEGFLK